MSADTEWSDWEEQYILAEPSSDGQSKSVSDGESPMRQRILNIITRIDLEHNKISDKEMLTDCIVSHLHDAHPDFHIKEIIEMQSLYISAQQHIVDELHDSILQDVLSRRQHWAQWVPKGFLPAVPVRNARLPLHPEVVGTRRVANTTTRTSRFLRLPPELRNEICGLLSLTPSVSRSSDPIPTSPPREHTIPTLLITRTGKASATTTVPPTFSQICTRLRGEIPPLFYGHNTSVFKLESREDLTLAKQWIMLMRGSIIRHMQNLVLHGFGDSAMHELAADGDGTGQIDWEAVVLRVAINPA